MFIPHIYLIHRAYLSFTKDTNTHTTISLRHGNGKDTERGKKDRNSKHGNRRWVGMDAGDRGRQIMNTHVNIKTI